MSSYAIGRFLPDEKALMQKSKGNMRGLVWVRKHGSPILLLSWVPLIGDLRCVAAGWLHVNWISALAFMAAGKFMRYWAIAAAMSPSAAYTGDPMMPGRGGPMPGSSARPLGSTFTPHET